MNTSTPKADDVRIMAPSQSEQSDSLQIQEKVVTTAQRSPIDDNNTNQQNVPTISPNLKRRRVSRACDICRRGKIKCDGKRPCTHCTVYSFGLASYARHASHALIYRTLTLSRLHF